MVTGSAAGTIIVQALFGQQYTRVGLPSCPPPLHAFCPGGLFHLQSVPGQLHTEYNMEVINEGGVQKGSTTATRGASVQLKM